MSQEIAQPLNIIQLAKGSQQTGVVGTDLQVRAIREVVEETIARDTWLLLLQGELIIDLPHHDFRILRVGDALTLPEGVHVSFNPVQESIVLLLP